MFRPIRSRALRALPAALLAALAATTAITSASAAPETTASAFQPIVLTPITVTPVPVLNLSIVPNCLNLTQSACDTQLVASGLQLGTVSLLAPQTPPPYIGSHVVSQSPAAGTLVRRGSAVNISIQPFGPPFRP